MPRVRVYFGLIAGVLLMLSGGAHSILGWEGIRGELARSAAPSDLMTGLKVSWHFGGVAMLAFGILVVELFVRRLKGDRVAMLPIVVIAAAYLVFGAWALVTSGFEPFFLVFVIPGILLAVAAPQS